jgi:hypothetical protein
MRAASAPIGTWAYVRAALLTLVLCSQCISALPSRALNTERLSRPEGQRALRVLEKVLRPLGAPARETIEGLLITGSERAVAARAALLSPLSAVFQSVAIHQQWRLFLSAHKQVFRLRIDTRAADADWTLVYRANQEDTLGLAPLLDYRRLRGIYNPTMQRVHREYPGFSRFIARRILDQHPELAAVRVSLEHIDIGGRHEPPSLLGTEHVMEHTRP